MKKFLLLNLISVISSFAFSQVTTFISPEKDNSIYSESDNSNALGSLYAGRTCFSDNRRALMQFDIAANLPAGATITGVTLTLNVSSVSPSVAAAQDFSLHPVTQAWGEGTSTGLGTGGAATASDATWNFAEFSATSWTTPGGDFGAAVATTNLPHTTGNFDWSSAGMITNVQNWLDNPSNNFGWILIGGEGTDCTAKQIGSKDQGTAPILAVTYTCATAPTAVCQNTTVALDSFGSITLSGTELDGGSIANCGGALTFSASPSTFDCSDILSAPGSLIITGVFDGPLTGGTPKGVELYVVNDIPDLSIYGVGVVNNGANTSGIDFTFPAVSASAGQFIYIASEIPEFTNFFGFAPDYIDSDVGVNGDDAFEIFENGVVVDVFGEIAVDGTGQPWEYLDGWAYRSNNTGPDGSIFNVGNWFFSGINVFDGTTTNATAPTPFPLGTYVAANTIPVTLTVEDEFSNTATCVSNIIVIDNLAPDANCIAPTTFNLDMSGNLTLTTGDINATSIDACGIASLTLDQTDFTCADLGVQTVTLTVTDNYGNSSQCSTDITIAYAGGITITEEASSDVTCNGDADGEIDISISGGTAPYIIDWDNDGTGDNDDSEDLTGLDGGTYTITVTDQVGCSSTLSVDIIEPDAIGLSADTVAIACFGNNTGSIDLTVSGGSSPYTFDWDNDGTGDFDDSEDLSSLAAGTYNVVVQDDNGCTENYSVTISEGAVIDIDVTVTGAFTLTSEEVGATYQWLDCVTETEITGETSISFEPVIDGEYAVAIENSLGCQDTSDCILIEGLSTNEFAPSNFVVYPNPSQNFIVIQSNLISDQNLVTITDLNGKIVVSALINSSNQTIDISQLESGIYIVTLQEGTAVSTTQITVLK